MWDWWYGPDRGGDDEALTIGPRVYDIDVVEGVVEIMRVGVERAARERRERGDLRPVLDDQTETVIYVDPPAVPGLRGGSPEPRTVAARDVANLDASERERLWIYGARIHVYFLANQRQRISGGGPAGTRDDIERYLRSVGRRRFPLKRLLAVLPVIAAAALVTLWVLMIVLGQVTGLAIAFGSLLTVGACVAAGFFSPRLLLWERKNGTTGVRFREDTRAERRRARTNLRAQILIGGGGTVVGAVILAALQVVFGFDIG